MILDTRKTLPGWRRLEKYAVRAGGGTNHRMGLWDACLIKDNHLAAWRTGNPGSTIAGAVAAARRAVSASVSVEVEVDTLEQLADALAGRPDIVLLDNMDVATLRECVALPTGCAGVQLEASGGIRLVGLLPVASPVEPLACPWLRLLIHLSLLQIQKTGKLAARLGVATGSSPYEIRRPGSSGLVWAR